MKKHIRPVMLATSLLVLGFGCKKDKNVSPVKKQVISFTKEGNLKLIKPDSTVLASIDIEIADNEYETQTGLMYRTSMKNNHGMLFIFPEEQPRYFYMKNTEIPLDIIYIGSDRKIVSIAANASPRNETSIPSNFPAQYVLEVNAGLSQNWGLEVGDVISFTRD